MTANAMQQMLEELKQSYIHEVPSKVEEMEALVMAIGKDEDVSDSFEKLFRKVHSLKGSAGTYGFNIITSICHQFEDYLESRELSGLATPAFVETGLAYVDLLQSACTAIINGETRFDDIGQSMENLSRKLFYGVPGVLLVTDQASLGGLCSSIAEGLGARVVSVRSGMAALQRLQHESFDLLVTGFENYELNGLALIAANRLSDGVSRKARTVLVTSSRGKIHEPDHVHRVMDPDVVVVRDASFAGAFASAMEVQLQLVRRAG